MPVQVQIVEQGPAAGCLVFLEALALAIWLGVKISHLLHPVAGILAGIGAAVAYGYLVLRPWLFYLAAAMSMALWGYLGYLLAAWIWPQDHVWQTTFALLGASITLADRLLLRSLLND